jgi:hypothetical protein
MRATITAITARRMLLPLLVRLARAREADSSPDGLEPLDLPEGECMVARAPMHAAPASRLISEQTRKE